MSEPYSEWLRQHLKEAMMRYDEVCKLDDHENAIGGTSEFYEQAHQMFGYIAALEKCLKQASAFKEDRGAKLGVRRVAVRRAKVLRKD